MKRRSFWGKRGLAVATSLVLCTSLIMPSFAATFGELQEAIRGNYTGDAFNVDKDDKGYTVTLNENVTRSGGDAVAVHKDGKAITVTINLNGNTIDGGSVQAAVFRVRFGSTLTIAEQDGAMKGGAGMGAVWVENGTFNMKGGTISNSNTTAAVRVDENGTFNMSGGTISGNKGGVYVNGGTFTMKNGTISGNSADNGGGVQVDKGGTFTMSGGTITENTSTASYGGGVYVNTGTFTMTGGDITGNTSHSSGGGVAINGKDGETTFVMSGGTISGNTTNGAGNDPGGGGVLVKSDAKFEMNGGKITGNSVTDGNGNLKGGGGGVAVHQGEFVMTAGTILGNLSARATGVQVNATEGTSKTSHFTMSGGSVSGDGDSCIWLEEVEGEHHAYLDLSGAAVLNGKIHLGVGTQIITNGVTQPDGDHLYTGFDVTYEDGTTEMLGTDKTGGEGYVAGQDTSAEIHYDCVVDGTKWIPNGTGHSRPCKYCPTKPMTAPVDHDYGAWSDAGNGKHSRRCTACGATETEAHSYGAWSEAGDGHSHTCTVCGATESADHSYGDWNVTEDSHSGSCTVCNAAAPENGGHSYNWVENEEHTMRTGTCTVCGKQKNEPIVPDPEEPEQKPEPDPDPDPEEPQPPVTTTPATTTPVPPVVIDDEDVPLGEAPEEGEAELEMIEDEAVPLAGLFTRAEAIGYLWEQAGSPDAALSDFADVPEDHEWAVAIGWAQEMGIAVADEDGNFMPDDLLLRSTEEIQGEFQEFLNRYAVFAGIELDDGELFIELDGDPDDIIMGEDAQEIFDGFFASLERATARRRD